MGKLEIVLDIRDTICKKLKEDERSLLWLSRKTGISYGTLYGSLSEKRFPVNAENLVKINLILGTSF